MKTFLKKNLILILSLAIVLSFNITSESSAESWNCGPQDEQGNYSDSVVCSYDKQSKTFTISGEGKMGDYSYRAPHSSNAPWAKKEIVHAVIQGNVTSIGKRIFEGIRSLEDISGTENITSIGEASFTYTALSSADFPKASYIERAAFYGAENLVYINLAENVTFGPVRDSYYSFSGTKIPDCAGGTCGSCSLIGKVEWDNACLDEYPFAKKRWTPAEANEWLHDGNDNFVVITFKK